MYNVVYRNISGEAFRGQVCSYIISIIFFYISENISGEAFRDEECLYNINNFVLMIHWNNCHKKNERRRSSFSVLSPSFPYKLHFILAHVNHCLSVHLEVFLFFVSVYFIYGFRKWVQWVNNLSWQHMLVLYLEDFH